MSAQVAAQQPAAGIAESYKAESVAVAAAQVYHRSGSNFLGRQEGKDAVQPHFPAHKASVVMCSGGKGAIDAADALAQASLRGRGPINYGSRNQGRCAPNQQSQDEAAE